jgi:hypothetical protein
MTDGRTEGRKEGRKEGRTAGRKEGRKAGRKEGRKEFPDAGQICALSFQSHACTIIDVSYAGIDRVSGPPTTQRKNGMLAGSGMVGYSYAADSHPGLSSADYEAIVPTNAALFNRSDYSDSTPKYNLSSWIPQVGTCIEPGKLPEGVYNVHSNFD